MIKVTLFGDFAKEFLERRRMNYLLLHCSQHYQQGEV